MILVIIHMLCWILAACCDSVCDTLLYHYNDSVFVKFTHRYWDPRLSWTNKYLMGDKEKGPRFPGSTTIFVWTTDAWHFFQAIMNASIVVVLLTGIYIYNNTRVSEFAWYWWVLSFILYKAMWGLVFEFLWRRLRK